MDRFDKIPYEDLSPEDTWVKLGQGSFGRVFKGDYLGLPVAIKEVMASGEYDVDKYFQREIKVMQEARHPNIVQYLGLCLAPSPDSSIVHPGGFQNKRILILSEFIEGPANNLRSYIYNTSLPFTWRIRMSFAVDIARAVAYLHARNCMHRDLKGENMLVEANGRVKMCDFGFARIAARNTEEMRRLSYCGTDGYLSPEILMGEEFGLPTDIFSMGVLFVEILTRKLVDNNTFTREMPTFGVNEQEVRDAASPGCPPALLKLTFRCLSVDPAERPGIREILAELRTIESIVVVIEEKENAAQNKATWNVGSVKFAGNMGTSQQALKNGSVSNKHASRLGLPDWESGNESSDDESVEKLKTAKVIVSNDDEDDEVVVSVFLQGVMAKPATERVPHHGYSTLKPFAKPNANNQAIDLKSAFTVSSCSLPSLPSSWLKKPDGTTVLANEKLGASGSGDKAENSDPEGSQVSYRTATYSWAGATVNHGSEASGTTALLDVEEANEESDTVGTIREKPKDGEEQEEQLNQLHRFSLMKPNLQRILWGVQSGGSELSKKGDAEWIAARGRGECRCCEKKLGVLKAYLECDDCGFRCHLKCSDICPPTCFTPLFPAALPLAPIPINVATPSSAAAATTSKMSNVGNRVSKMARMKLAGRRSS